MEIPCWQVHRGYWQGGVRENTLQAFSAAHRLGAKMIELDVRVSRDGVPVVFHDQDLDRIFHIKKLVHRTKFEELDGLNVCSLADVLKSNNVPKYINIELKSESYMPLTLVRSVARLALGNHNKKVILSSFNPFSLMLSRYFMPDIPRAFLLSSARFLQTPKMKQSMMYAKPQMLNVAYKLLEIDEARKKILSFQLPISVWTVNNLQKAQYFLDKGAISIISDEPPPVHLR